MRVITFVLALAGCVAALVCCYSPTASAHRQTRADISNVTACNVYAYAIDKDPHSMGGPLIAAATELMQALIAKSHATHRGQLSTETR